MLVDLQILGLVLGIFREGADIELPLPNSIIWPKTQLRGSLAFLYGSFEDTHKGHRQKVYISCTWEMQADTFKFYLRGSDRMMLRPIQRQEFLVLLNLVPPVSAFELCALKSSRLARDLVASLEAGLV